jgi:Mn2+/Fe2+ NRAMP family transporter
MANIGTTIAPWMIFFQQSAVVDKGMQEKDILWGKIDTAVGSLLTVIVAAGCVVLTATLLPGQIINDAATAALRFMPINRYVGALRNWPVRCGVPRRNLHFVGKFVGLR